MLRVLYCSSLCFVFYLGGKLMTCHFLKMDVTAFGLHAYRQTCIVTYSHIILLLNSWFLHSIMNADNAEEVSCYAFKSYERMIFLCKEKGICMTLINLYNFYDYVIWNYFFSKILNYADIHVTSDFVYIWEIHSIFESYNLDIC